MHFYRARTAPAVAGTRRDYRSAAIARINSRIAGMSFRAFPSLPPPPPDLLGEAGEGAPCSTLFGFLRFLLPPRASQSQVALYPAKVKANAGQT